MMKDPRFAPVKIEQEERLPEKKKAPVKGFPYISFTLLGIIILCCIFADIIAAKDPAEINLQSFSSAPCREFIFGTDSLGRDIFSCLLHGGRISIFIGLFATAISTVIAIIYGTISGLAPAWADAAMMRLTEIMLSIPSLLTVIFLQSILGEASVISISAVIGVTGWFSMAKVIRTEVKQLKSSEYVLASRALGGNLFHILRVHLLPNFIPSIMFMVVMNVSSAIAAESALSFMGLGLPLDVISLGSMLSLAQNALTAGLWWIILIPGVFLVVILMSMTEIGSWLRKRANRKNAMM